MHNSVIEYIVTSVKTPEVATAAAEGFNAVLVGQWALAIGSVLTILYGVFDKIRAGREGARTVEKNAYDQIIEENKLLIHKLQLMQKDSDKWHLSRIVMLSMTGGHELIKDIEKKADEISSDEN